ncbi:unnamed protein product [Thelazia callipaeda]|uniref:MFS domain-containing protein n=1 Tax=Thelazia callipaeda TaxID=103827 RepID=A0A0N5DAE1_THECL|nr:unnamed protein product [Thelazia callipaeda]
MFMQQKTLKNAEEGTEGVRNPNIPDEEANNQFKVSDLQTCGKYIAFLSVVYFLMALSQVCNLLFMTFADRKPQVEDYCEKIYPKYTSTKTCNVTHCWIRAGNPPQNKICATKSYDFIPIRYDFDVPLEYVKLGTTMQNVGLMIGAIVAGNLADIYGRKKVLLTATVGLIVFLVVTPLSPSFAVFTILRFFDMLFTGGQHCVCNPFFMENLPDKHRMWMANVITYSPNYIILSGIAYLCKQWKTLSLAAAGISVIPLITLPFLKESPRWLIKKGKSDEALKAAAYIRKWDHQDSPEMEQKIISVVKKAAEDEQEKKKKGGKNYYVYHLFSDWNLGCYTLVFATSLFSASFVSFGVAYNMDALAGTVYINVIILGFLRWGINITAASLEYFFENIGRRLLHLVAVGFIATVMGVTFIIYRLTWPKIDAYKAAVKAGEKGDPSIHSIVLFTRYACLLAAAMCSEVFVLNAVQPSELFPTPVRSAGIAFIQIFNRLGTIVGPLVFIPSKHWPPAPFLLMFITSSADFLLYFLLVPETRGKRLPDHMPGEYPSDEMAALSSEALKSEKRFARSKIHRKKTKSKGKVIEKDDRQIHKDVRKKESGGSKKEIREGVEEKKTIEKETEKEGKQSASSLRSKQQG